MDEWDRRIERATVLTLGAEAELMTTYRQLLMLQRACDERLRREGVRLTGALDDDLPILRDCATHVFALSLTFDPPPLAESLPSGAEIIDALLRDGWQAPAPQLYARIVLQPYAEWLVQRGSRPDRHLPTPHAGASVCPFCGGPPQLAILRHESGEAGARLLQCALCATTWPIRRVLCAACGETDERHLPYFHAPTLPHIRLDTCDTCRHYLKTIDLTTLGLAVPLVDEVAAAVIDVWAVQQGLEKIAINLIGL